MTENKKRMFSFKYKQDEYSDFPLNLNVGEVKVIKDKDFCLTCSGTRRMVWAELEGNKKIVKKVCLYCCTRVHTERNEIER